MISVLQPEMKIGMSGLSRRLLFTEIIFAADIPKRKAILLNNS